jgi:PAS domain S-box-containing protein
MKLRPKTVLLIVAIYVPLILIFYLGVRTLLLRNHRKLEDDNTRQNLLRVYNTINYDLGQLDALNFDWSAWDDTCRYVIDRNSEFQEANLIAETYAGTRLDFIAFVTASNRQIFGQTYDRDTEEVSFLDESTTAFIRDNLALLTPGELLESVEGYTLLGERPMLISSRHIINSRNEGPSHGLLIMGRMITPAFVREINDVTRLNVELLSDPRLMTPQENGVYNELLNMNMLIPDNTRSMIILPQEPEAISGYMLITGITGTPVCLVRVTSPRSIYRSGQRSLIYLILYFIVIGVVSGFILMELLEKVLVSRMIKLSNELKRIANAPNTPVLLDVSQNDELSSIAYNVNHLLKVLSARRQALLDSEIKYRSFAENFQGIAYRTDLNFTPVFFHGAVKAITGYNEQDFLSSTPSWKDIVLPEDLEGVMQSSAACRQQQQFSCERQYRIRRKDGKIRWVHEYMQSIHDRQTDPVFLQGAIYDITTRKENEEAIRQAKERLNMLTRHLQQVREEESSRIAQRIHDELGQLLMALKIDIKWLQKNISAPENIREQIINSLHTLDQIEACINNISTELKPPVLDSLGLEDAAQWLINSFSREYSTSVSFSCEMGSFNPGRHFSTTVYRILQEALINCYRHANATQINITMQAGNRHFLLSINDNGSGIPDESLNAYSSFGINQMRERAEYLNATLTITTDPDSGTQITLLVPMKNNPVIQDQHQEKEEYYDTCTDC